MQYLIDKIHDQSSVDMINDQTIFHSQLLGHPINQLSGKIKAFQGANALAWQQQIRGEWDETRLSD